MYRTHWETVFQTSLFSTPVTFNSRFELGNGKRVYEINKLFKFGRKFSWESTLFQMTTIATWMFQLVKTIVVCFLVIATLLEEDELPTFLTIHGNSHPHKRYVCCRNLFLIHNAFANQGRHVSQLSHWIPLFYINWRDVGFIGWINIQ